LNILKSASFIKIEGLCYVCITGKEMNRSEAFSFLFELKNLFMDWLNQTGRMADVHSNSLRPYPFLKFGTFSNIDH
jgi:hypothetical protein